MAGRPSHWSVQKYDFIAVFIFKKSFNLSLASTIGSLRLLSAPATSPCGTVWWDLATWSSWETSAWLERCSTRITTDSAAKVSSAFDVSIKLALPHWAGSRVNHHPLKTSTTVVFGILVSLSTFCWCTSVLTTLYPSKGKAQWSPCNQDFSHPSWFVLPSRDLRLLVSEGLIAQTSQLVYIGLLVTEALSICRARVVNCSNKAYAFYYAGYYAEIIQIYA